MINKLDKNLINVMTLTHEDKVDCVVFINNYISSNLILKDEYKNCITGEYPFINAISFSLSKTNMLKIASYDFVKYISSFTKAQALINVAKDILCNGNDGILTGKEIGIAFIDTGIAPHLDFVLGNNRIKKFIDLYGRSKKPYDDNGHGTFISGVCAGNGFLSNKKYEGIANKATIYSLKALNKDGEASATKILDAMQWIYDNAKKEKIRVVCMSFGSEPLGLNDPIMKGAEALWQKGLVVVAAAGNSGPQRETIKSPGISSRIITVGAMDDNRFNEDEYNPNFFEIANFSSRGPALKHYKPDIVAPGVNITSCSNKGGYLELSGTSVATPMIAGLSALIIEKRPNLKPEYVKRILLSSCKAITYNRNLEGFGYPNFQTIKSILK